MLWFDKATCVDKPFIHCTEEDMYAGWLPSFSEGNLSLTDDSQITRSPD